MWKSELFFLVSLACSTFVKGQGIEIEAILQDACLKECRPDRPGLLRGNDICYMAHPFDCFKFVICIPMLRIGAMNAQVMSCAFGTMWNDTENACQRSDLVRCGNDPCKNGTVTRHQSDLNCRTYWKCVDQVSEPDCCPRYHSFDPVTKNCVSDLSCSASCPFLNDATCASPGVKTLDYGDRNCKTYFKCRNSRPIPTCCPDGYGYDLYEANCTLDTNCSDPCPLDYKDRCADPGITAYPLRNDSNCRTYMKCNSKGQGEPYCCRSGMEFDETLQICVDTISSNCKMHPCPLGYKEECRLESVPHSTRMYKNLDYFGGEIMPCAVGTIFIQERCLCVFDPITSTVAPGIGECEEEIHAIMPSLKNNGSVIAALLMVGKYGQGEKGVGNITAFWDGDDGINIPYFGSQTPSKLYIEIVFKPTGTTPGKQVLLSSCYQIGDKISLEISLMSDQNNSGTLKTRLASPGLGLSRTFTMPYKIRDNYNFKLIYNGSEYGAILTQTAGPPIVRSGNLTGQIPIHLSGLRITKCRYDKGVSGFIGYVSEIKISKCLKPAMTRELEEILKASHSQPGSQTGFSVV